MKENAIRCIISNTILSFEAGEFQEFCKEYLPLIDSLYIGLERHGGTVEGKTRKGTPDFIKTKETGEIIAVQCSIDEKYWNMPGDTSKFGSTWKPCQDIKACVEKLNNLQEIVLCSNRETPTGKPNIKSEIIKYANQITQARITIISLQNIENALEEFISDNAKHNFFKKYFPNIYEILTIPIEHRKAFLQKEIQKQKPYMPTVALEQLTEQAFRAFQNPEEATAYVLKEVDKIQSRYEIIPPPQFQGIKRTIDQEALLINPIGKILSLTGATKIGKTSFLSQCSESWKKNGWAIKWFNCPEDIQQVGVFREYLLKSILCLGLPNDVVFDLVAGKMPLSIITQNDFSYSADVPTVIVVDNSEAIVADMGNLCKYLNKIIGTSLGNNLGIIFGSNKPIKYLCNGISDEISISGFDDEEMKKLLQNKIPSNKNILEKKYIDNLLVSSGGHPLIAVAIANKYPKIEDLIVATLTRESFLDEDLNDKAANLLFQDILENDRDVMDFVLRLSPLIYRARPRAINIIMKKVKPEIGKTREIILDKLLGAVVEGDEAQGYSVSHLYKKVAQKKIRPDEARGIYKILGSELLKPKEKTLNAMDVIEGAYYSILSENFELAYFWLIILLQSINKNKFTVAQKQNILDYLEAMTYIKPSKDSKAAYLYFGFMLSMVQGYTNINDNEKALKVLEKIDYPEAVEEGVKDVFEALREATKIQKFLIEATRQPNNAIKILTQIEFSKLKKIGTSLKEAFSIMDMAHYLVNRLNFNEFPRNLFEYLEKHMDYEDGSSLFKIMDIASSIGVKASHGKVTRDILESLFESDKEVVEIAKLIAMAEYELNGKNYKGACSVLVDIIRYCRNAKFDMGSLISRIHSIAGDMYYGEGKKEKARRSYKKSAHNFIGERITFEYGWSNYRLGLLADNAMEAAKYFNIAYEAFKNVQYEKLSSKSKGELAVTMVEQGQLLSFMNIAEEISNKYYIENNQEYAIACAIILGQVTRLTYMVKDEKIMEKDGIIYPDFKRGIYDSASDELKPRAGGISAYYALSLGYECINRRKEQLECLQKAMSFGAILPAEEAFKPIIGEIIKRLQKYLYYR